jgi:S-adenosylmethionine hydrolase
VRPVVLLTDFGLRDHYAGVLHAILERQAPGVGRIDLSHQVPPGDLWTASFLLRSAWQHLPENAVVLAVVDPGVGGPRRAVAARVGGRWLVGPDNGIVSAAGAPSAVVELDWVRMGLAKPSSTFHGRDLFAPAAARIARGDDPQSLGEEIDTARLSACPLPAPVPIEGGHRAAVLHVDRFGNLITNLPAAAASTDVTAWYGAPRGAPVVATYSEAGEGQVVLLEGSSGLLELAVNRDSAADITGLAPGDTVDIISDRLPPIEGRTTESTE